MYADPDHTRAMSKSDVAHVMEKHEALGDELLTAGELVGGAGLALPDETTLLRLAGDEVVAEDRPFDRDSTEQLSAYYEIECETPERAQEIAGRVLDDHVTAVELRRIHDTARTGT
jgi:hypothetical protein